MNIETVTVNNLSYCLKINKRKFNLAGSRIMLSFNKDKIYANTHTFEKNVFFPGLIRKWKNIFCSEILMDSFRKIFAKYRIINLNMMQIGELNLKKKETNICTIFQTSICLQHVF